MKKLQNNFTTPEQSNRLLELGLPANSADCYYARGFNKHTQEWNYDSFPTIIMEGMFEIEPTDIPCWSAGRLIGIMKICNHPDDVDQVFCELAYSKKNLVELIVRLMEENKEITDFSKLEE